ncbi:hypothetical protein D3C87_1604970 [compost metagenome]
MKSVFLFLAALTLSFSAQASIVKYKSEEAFRAFVEKYDNSMNEVEMDLKDLTKAQIQAIQTYAKESSDVWADTVLEGPYQLNWKADLVVDAVTGLYNSQGELAAYYVTFSQEAWFTDSCEIDEEADDSQEPRELYAQCGAGSIVGYMFVSGDLKYAADDWNNPADFQED